MDADDKAAFEAWWWQSGDEYRQAQKAAWQAALQYRDSHPMVRLTRKDIDGLISEDVFLGNCHEIAEAIMDALEVKNRRMKCY